MEPIQEVLYYELMQSQFSIRAPKSTFTYGRPLVSSLFLDDGRSVCRADVALNVIDFRSAAEWLC